MAIRIIWCYSQYQPLYDRLKREIQNIEFHSGIPDDISEDYFLDTKVNNLIVLDDLMTEVKNDTRIGQSRKFTSIYPGFSGIYV
jgi:hypothetical protein